MKKIIVVFLFIFMAVNIMAIGQNYLELFSKVLHLIENEYYRPVDRKKVVEGAIKGMLETLDPHSSFLDETKFKQLKEDTSGKFGGLGIEVTQKDNQIVIVDVLPKSPAAKAGLKRNDRIVEINNSSIVDLDMNQALDKIQGKVGEEIRIGIARSGLKIIKQFLIKREIITLEPVESSIIQGAIVYIKIVQFQKNTALILEKRLKSLADSIGEKKLKGIVLDLRNNPGGLLDEAVNVASVFIESGVVVSTRARDENKRDIHYVKKSFLKYTKQPLIVLINGSTASAAEIVTGAIQDYKRGVILGVQSFGKGSVQAVLQLGDNIGLKLTIAEYLTPNKRKIQALGIKPDIEIVDLTNNDGKIEEEKFLREVDLKNHLTSVLGSEEEHNLRVSLDKKRLENNKLSSKFNPKETLDRSLLKAKEILLNGQYTNIIKSVGANEANKGK